jgi:carbon monoxide dehydrogenase subunit G
MSKVRFILWLCKRLSPQEQEKVVFELQRHSDSKPVQQSLSEPGRAVKPGKMVVQKIRRSFDVEAEPEKVWSFLWDIEALARCIPGSQEVSVQSEGESYRARVGRKVGPFVLGFELNIRVVQSEAPRLIRVEISGRDKRLKSELRQNVAIDLNSTGNGHSKVDVATTINLSGVLASLGERALSAHIHQVLDDFVRCLQGAIEERRAKGFV